MIQNKVLQILRNVLPSLLWCEFREWNCGREKDSERLKKVLRNLWNILPSDLIFVTNITNIINGEKLSCGQISAFHVWQLWGNWKFLHMWRNLRCLYMTDVEKSEILHIWHVCDVENVAIYAKFMLFSWKNQFFQNLRTLSRNPFCRNLRTFVWRKIYPKKFYVEKKWQIWGLSQYWKVKIECIIIVGV